jgi:hypothetical protein
MISRRLLNLTRSGGAPIRLAESCTGICLAATMMFTRPPRYAPHTFDLRGNLPMGKISIAAGRVKIR